MKTTTSLMSILSLTATMFFFVSCSNNDAVPSANMARNTNETMSTWNIPHGKLHIINNTNHVFEGDLLALRFGYQLDNDDYLLWQHFRIAAVSEVWLSNYHDTNTTGMDVVAPTPDKWFTLDYMTSAFGSISGVDASSGSLNFMTTDSNGIYVNWLGMDFTDSNDGLVTLKFKINYTTGEIDVNGAQNHDDGSGGTTFITTGVVETNGNTTITIDDF